jgi:hypothetical protein
MSQIPYAYQGFALALSLGHCLIGGALAAAPTPERPLPMADVVGKRLHDVLEPGLK